MFTDTTDAPSPSPSSTMDAGEAVAQTVNHTWDWLTGPGLRIAIILVIGGLLLLVVQRLIRSVTEHIADGSSFLQRGIVRPLGTEVAGALRKANPVAAARRTQRARTIGSVLRSTAAIVIGTITVFLVLDQVGVNLAPFIASAGIVGVALGFGAQSLVKDFLTGLFMLLEDQYGVGDVVDVGPASGTVESVGLRVTKIRDADGVLWYVPNGSVLRVGNKTQGWSNAVVEVKVDYFVDLDRVEALLRKAATEVAADDSFRTLVEGNPTVTSAEDLSFDAVTMRLVQRTVPAQQWKVSRALREAVRRELAEAGIPLAGQREALTAFQESQAQNAEGPGDPTDPGAPTQSR
ncbi:mechanosensitive ion channel domain-containing protein [Cellulomonas sp. NPDC089187]|uniref:mechanosensitive ion channel family protein n=1 Tax=Cellulomonas sp. NPDC089187 TaxID=3154970 RepID=UPI003426B840